MFHKIRSLHKWFGLVSALFMVVIAVTGFLLATKSTLPFIRPPESQAEKVESLQDVVSIGVATDAAFALGIAELKTAKDIDRVDYRPKSNIFKILSKEGYHEVQVDGKTGKVIQVMRRNDQLAEDIHDLSFFSDALHKYGLPLVAIVLVLLSISGIIMYVTPVLRRRAFKKQQAQLKK